MQNHAVVSAHVEVLTATFELFKRVTIFMPEVTFAEGVVEALLRCCLQVYSWDLVGV